MGHELKVAAASDPEDIRLFALKRQREIGGKAVFTAATIVAYGFVFWVVLGVWLP